MTRLQTLIRTVVFVIWILALCALLLSSASAAFRYLQVGMETPVISGIDCRSGEAVDTGTLADSEALLIVFWATWSDRSLEQLGDLVKIHGQFEDYPLRIIAVNVEGPNISPATRTHIVETVSSLDPPFPVIIDQGLEIFYQFGVIAVPSTAIVGSDATLRYDPAGYSHTVRDRIVDSTAVLLGL